MILTTRRLFVATLFIALFVMAGREVVDPDFGWHLQTGRYIVTTFSVPHTDIFSITAAGQQWITHEWLTESLMYLLYRLGGFGALTIFFAAISFLAFALVYERCEGQPYVAGFVVLGAAITAAPFWGARPQTLSLLYTSIFLLILNRYQHHGADRQLLWLAPVFLIWVNSHGSFALGLALIAVYMAGNTLQRVLQWNNTSQRSARDIASLGGMFTLCVGIIALNPNGLALYLYPFQTLSSYTIQTFIQEWQPPDFATAATQPFLWFVVVLVGMLALKRRRMDLVDSILLAGLTLASLRNARQISIWVLIAAPILSAAIVDVLGGFPWKIAAPSNPTSRIVQVLNGTLLVIVALAGLVRLATVVGNQTSAERDHFPVTAVNFISQNKIAGPIFNQYDWGGYLIWKLYPQARVFIDGRSDLYGLTNDLIVREYFKAYTATSDWYEPLERYGVRLVLVEPSAPLAARLAEDTTWKKMYADNQAVIFEKSD